MKKRYLAGLALGGLSLVAVATQVFEEEPLFTDPEIQQAREHAERYIARIEQAREEADRMIAELKEAQRQEQAKMDAMSPEELDAYLEEKTKILRRVEEEMREFERQQTIRREMNRSDLRRYDI